MDKPSVTLTPLGGLGEIGMNCLCVETPQSLILIDCGLMFPEYFLYGVDIVIPRFDFILERKEKLCAVIVTHGHEDHIGGLPWLLPEIDVPVYASEFTRGLIGNKLRDKKIGGKAGFREYDNFHIVTGGDVITLADDIRVTFFPVCHSIMGGFGLGIQTPLGNIIHTGDFKIDRDPLHGVATDLEAFCAFAKDDCLLLLSDSTNVEREGFALTEREIKDALEGIFHTAQGRLIITLFASHIQRIQEIFELAVQHHRKVAVSGRSLLRNIELARDLGYIHIQEDSYISMEEVPEYADEELVLLVTGSQGEPLAALSRIASGEHRQLRIHEGDMVLMSSRMIPGNARAISKVINNLYRLGAEVLYEDVQGIHASGHAYREELRIMLETVRPKFFVPVHGEYRHLVKHRRLAVAHGVAPERALLVENGTPLTLLPEGAVRFEEPVDVQRIFVDGKGVGDVGSQVLRERQLLGEEGLVVVTLVVDEHTGDILTGPDISSRGFVFEQQYSHILEEAQGIVLDVIDNIDFTDTDKRTERIRSSLRRFFRKVLGRDPVVLPLLSSV